MGEATSTSRVVRVSNLHTVQPVKWLAAACAPLMLACAVYLLLPHARPHQDDRMWGMSAGGLALLATFGVFIPSLQLLLAGTWIADERGIEFVPYLPRVRRWQFVAWSEIQRVRWVPILARLQAADAEVMVHWRELSPADRDALKARICTSLGENFDLSLPPRPAARPSQELPALRRLIALSTVPIGSVLLGYAIALHHPEHMRLMVVLMCAWIPVLYVVAIVIAVRQQRSRQSPARWRTRLAPAAVSAAPA